MTAVEIVAAALFAAGGIRSLWTWTRRRFEGVDVVDHLLYALNVTVRVGLWFAFAGFFVLSALTRNGGGASDLEQLRWYAVVPIVLASIQFLSGFALGRRSGG